MRRPLLRGSLLVAALSLGCSGGKDNTMPTEPDDPTPPLLAFEPEFFPSSQTILLVPPVEDLQIESFRLDLQHSGSGGLTAATDFTPGIAAQGDTFAIHVTTPWTWQESDRFNIGVRASRPGQQIDFPLCCLGCNHDGGYLQNGPCTR